MLSPITSIVIGVATLSMFLACIDWNPTRSHHSQTQKRHRGKFVKKYQKAERRTVKFDYVDARKLRRVA